MSADIADKNIDEFLKKKPELMFERSLEDFCERMLAKYPGNTFGEILRQFPYTISKYIRA